MSTGTDELDEVMRILDELEIRSIDEEEDFLMEELDVQGVRVVDAELLST